MRELNPDAGYDPVYAGGLENARILEGGIGLWLAIGQESGPFF